MFVPIWVVWLVLVPAMVLAAPFVLLGLVWVIARVRFWISPPAPGSILDPAAEHDARGKSHHGLYATPYLDKGDPWYNPPPVTASHQGAIRPMAAAGRR